MSDITADIEAAVAAMPTVVEPEEGEEGDELLLVRGGYIRYRVEGRRYTLRRPKLGQLRELEAQIDHAQEELKSLAERMREADETDSATAEAIDEEIKAGVTPARKRELDRQSTQLSLNLQDRMQEVIRMGRDLREDWWRQVFTMLSPEGQDPPDDMPAWVGNAATQGYVIAHWQSDPLARGVG
jgi:hypothetical protein